MKIEVTLPKMKRKSRQYLFERNRRNGRRLLYSFLILIFVLSLSSCRSHKKIIETEEEIIVEELLKSNRKKKKEDGRLREMLAREAQTWIGTPYVYGKQNKGSGTDCSGLTMVVYQEVANIKIPRNSARQAEFCKEIKAKEVRAGDLVFFATGKDPRQVSHVGMMIDERRFVHASSSKGVIISEMIGYYERKFVKYGRVPSM